MFKVGFEIECIVNDVDEYELAYQMEKIGFSSDGDYSINPRNYEVGIEWRSDPLPLKEAKSKLKIAFHEIFPQYRVRTNKSCGLHINISEKRKDQPVIPDPEILISTIDEASILHDFGRDKNGYCVAWEAGLRKFFTKIYKGKKELKFPSYRKFQDIAKIEFSKLIDSTMLNMMYVWPSLYISHPISGNSDEPCKYMATNINHLMKKKYVEYRMCGNTGYEKRYDEIVQVVDYLIECQSFASVQRNKRIVDPFIRSLLPC